MWPTNSYVGTLFFEAGDGRSGWSEVYYFIASDHEEALENLDDLATLRLGLLTPNYKISYMRVSDPSIRGDALIDAFGQAGTFGDTSTDTLPASSALLLRQTNEEYKSSFRYLHGLPESINQDGNLIFIPPADDWWAALTLFTDFLEGFTYYHSFNKLTDTHTLGIISILNYVRITNHRVGRPFGLPRGRGSRCPTG